MKNIEYCKYTYAHKKIVEFLVDKYIKDEATKQIMIEKAKIHDMDKLTSYLFYSKDVASKNHQLYTSHHKNNIPKTKYDYIEMVLDWESARYTKPDKPLNAYDTLYKYYPEMENEILPILKELGLDKPNTPFDEDVKIYADKVLSDITEENIVEEVISYIRIIGCQN